MSGFKYPVDTDQFQRIREDGKVYVDKNGMMYSLVNIYLAIFTNPLKLVGIYRVLESAHVICNLSNKHFSRCKKTNLLWNTQV